MLYHRDAGFAVSPANMQAFAKFLSKEMDASSKAKMALASKPRMVHNKRDEYVR